MIRVTFLLLLFGSMAYAQNLSLYATLLHFNYEEQSQEGTFLDSEKSNYSKITGFEVRYGFDMPRGLSAKKAAFLFSFAYNKGETVYDGSLFSVSNPSLKIPYKSITDVTLYEPMVRYKESNEGDFYTVSLFTSLGYRYWKRDMRRDVHGYLEEYTWGFFDIGSSVVFHDGAWHLGFEAAYKQAIAPKLSTSLTRSDFTLGKTNGYDIVIPLSYDVTQALALEVIYEFDYWKIRRSNVVDGYVEPQSSTKNEYLRFGVVYKW